MPNFVSITTAAECLRNANRVSIVGCSGGGKSTLARHIELVHGLPHISIDRCVRWLPVWEVRDGAQQRILLNDFAAQEQWILDGTTISSFEARMPRSDLVLWVQPTRSRALWQLAKRVYKSYGQVRPDMAPGCPEKLPDREFLRYIWTFDRLQTPRILNAIDTFGPNVPIFIIKQNAESAELIRQSK